MLTALILLLLANKGYPPVSGYPKARESISGYSNWQIAEDVPVAHWANNSCSVRAGSS